MKIYLLNPPFTPRFGRPARWQSTGRGGTLYYPLWLAYATGVLEQRYPQVRLVDAPAWGWGKAEVLTDVTQFSPDLVIIDSSFTSLFSDVAMAAMIKEQVGQVKTVLVGPPTSQFPQRIFQRGGVDIVARYEYDFTVRDIAKAIEKGKGLSEVRGISYKQDGEVVSNPDRKFLSSQELDSIPFVSKVYKEHLNIKDYSLNHTLYPEVQVFTSRGCPNRCTFCSWPETLTGRQYRVRSVSNVVDELEYIREELPQVKEVFFEDDTFTIDRERVIATCEEIKRRKLRITWSCNARANLDFETMKVMKESGCRLLDVGYESGNKEILEKVRKGISIDRMRIFARQARRARLMVLGDFVFGLPGETRETAERTLRFAKELKPDIVQFAVAVPIPGTEFYNWAKEKGFLLVDDLEAALDEDGFQKAIVSYPEFSSKQMEAYVDRGLKEYYLSLSYIPIALGNILRGDTLSELRGLLRSAKAFLQYLRRKRKK